LTFRLIDKINGALYKEAPVIYQQTRITTRKEPAMALKISSESLTRDQASQAAESPLVKLFLVITDPAQTLWGDTLTVKLFSDLDGYLFLDICCDSTLLVMLYDSDTFPSPRDFRDFIKILLRQRSIRIGNDEAALRIARESNDMYLRDIRREVSGHEHLTRAYPGVAFDRECLIKLEGFFTLPNGHAVRHIVCFAHGNEPPTYCACFVSDHIEPSSVCPLPVRMDDLPVRSAELFGALVTKALL
jgi:hypothetical protein